MSPQRRYHGTKESRRSQRRHRYDDFVQQPDLALDEHQSRRRRSISRALGATSLVCYLAIIPCAIAATRTIVHSHPGSHKGDLLVLIPGIAPDLASTVDQPWLWAARAALVLALGLVYAGRWLKRQARST